uniref:Uncharacterized protein n=1 Tax=Knipowitschia caucasica TaxID=637954 RepID=A0AAV2LKK9_KNICA
MERSAGHISEGEEEGVGQEEWWVSSRGGASHPGGPWSFNPCCCCTNTHSHRKKEAATTRAEPTAVEQAILFALKERPVPPPTATREFSHIEYYLLVLLLPWRDCPFYDLERGHT